MINTEDLKQIMSENENLYYGRNYINIHDHVPIAFVHCYNYTEDEAEKLSRYFDSFFYYKLYEFHMENKIVLMFINMDEMVMFINRTEECK